MLRVMFMQSQTWFGADSELHAQLLRYMDRAQVALSVALTASPGFGITSAKREFEAIPDIIVRPTAFGMSLQEHENKTVLRRLMAAPQVLIEGARLARFIRRHRIQIIHGTEKPRDAFYGVLLAKLAGARTVIHMHVNYGDWLAPMVKWALKHADAIIAVSPFSARTLLDAGFPAERVHTVLNALDLSSGRWDGGSAVDDTRRSLGVPDGALVLGIVARLFLYKGHRELLQALASIKDRMPPYRLVVVGEDDLRAHPGGGSFSAELQHLAETLGIREHVIFTGFRTDVPQLMEAFDMYVMPSFEEPFGMVFLEAMAFRKPVVALRMAGSAEIVVDGETGYLVTPGSVQELADAILKLATNPELRAQLGEAGRRRVEDRFSSRRMCDDVLKVYRSLVPRSEPGP